MPSFVHLHVHSHYSLLDGLTRIDELVAAAKADGQPALALTDHGAMYGAIEFYKACKKAGVKPIIGIEAYLAPRSRTDREKQADERAYSHLILLAKNRTGYQNLLQLTTKSHLEGFYYKPRIDWDLLEQHGDGLIALSGCMGGEIPRLIRDGKDADVEAAVKRYRDRFGPDFYFELQHRSDIPEIRTINARLLELSQRHGVPIVATNDVHYLKHDDAEAQDVLLCLQTKSKQEDRDRLSMMGENYSFRTAKEMALLFEDHPEALANTLRIADACTLEIELDKIQLPAYALPRGETNETYLKKLCVKGLERRYAPHPPTPPTHPLPLPLRTRGRDLPEGGGETKKNFSPSHREGSACPPLAGEGVGKVTMEQARERLDYELGVVTQMGLSSYFLIVQDFVNWAKGQGIVVGPGRGSAAGSIVSYLLNITNLDPIAYNLLFERFLAPGRIQMPDIDIDFADHRRDEVIRYVKQRYGEDRVAQIITFGTMAARASVRDVGRVLDVPYAFCDRLAKLIPLHASLDEAVRDVDELRELSEADETTQRLLAIAKRLEGAARHTSTHACGVVITADPLVASVPLQRASADDATIITQYEMHAVENLGLLKMDFLGLSNLSIIEHAVNIIRERGTAIDIEQLPLDDAPTFALLQAGETTGVFQLESGGMKRYLKDLKPSQFEDIIAMVALYRPGPMELIPEYIDRKFGRKPIAYLHPKLETVLKNTYGIMVYQEQLMQLARELAGFTMAQADTLRKAVGKKIKKLLDEQRAKLIEGMVGNKIPEKTAKKIWEWIEPFARYGFNRSHAACYALIAYQTAYLKAHYPAEFMAALLTAERGDTDRLAVLIQECREMEIAVLGPDINESDVLFTVVDDDGKSAIRFGLAAIKNVGEHLVEMLVAERKANGPYPSLEDLCARTKDKDFNKKSLECIIKSGCLECFGERGQLLAAVETILTYHRAIAREAEIGQESLFQSSGKRTPLIIPPSEPAAQRMRLAWEKELLGLYLSSHPFESTAKAIGSSIISIADLKKGSGDQQGIFGGVITRMKRIVTKKGDGMLFAELEDHTGNIEVVVFPRVLTATAPAWIAETTILVRGKRSDRDGEVKMLADHVVQVVPGREAEALRSVGGSTVNPYAPPRDEPMRPVTFQLPAALPPERLRDLRTFLERSPGTVPVRLRSVDGRLVSTGVRIAWTPELRAGVEEILGVGTVREEVAEVVP